MGSETTMVAAQFRIQEWAAQIKECQNRPAGMSVAGWCTCNGITKANYYYRLRRVREACLESIPKKPAVQQVVPVEPVLLEREEKACDCPSPGLDISIRGCSVHVTEKTSLRLLVAVLKVVRGAE